MFKRAVIQPSLLIATMLLATACTAKSPEAVSESASSAAAPVVASTVASEAATSVASDAAASNPAPAIAAASTAASTAAPAVAAPKGMPAGPTPVEGTDYTTIDTPDQPTGAKVQVTEVFGYGCPHCAAFQPHMTAWEKTLPSDVQLTYLPAAFGADPVHCWDDFARAFYAAQAMGVQVKSHDNIYKAVFDQHRFNGCASIPALYADYGVDAKVFASTMQSFAVSAKIAAAHEQAVRWGVDATPTVIVDGKYRLQETAAGGPTAMLHTIDWLVAKQRPEHAKH